MCAIRPTSVCMPVLVTIPKPEPVVTMVVIKPILIWSPKLTCLLWIALTCFVTGSDSPVSAASSIDRRFASTMRTSAGRMSPVLILITSPGTKVRAGTCIHLLSRRTSASGAAISRSASMPFWALYSCQKEMPVLITMMVPIAMASMRCPVNQDTKAPTNRM